MLLTFYCSNPNRNELNQLFFSLHLRYIVKTICMKKLLLMFTLVSAAITASAQCTPGADYPSANWADTAVSPGYGVWPDTVENFPPAYDGVPYSANLSFMVPDQVTAELAGTDPTAQGFIGSPIQGFIVTDVAGLPAGLTYQCNQSNCDYPGGAFGCANVSGTTTAVGTHPVEIFITATITIDNPLLFPPTIDIDYPTSFTGYKIEVGTNGQVELTQAPYIVVPNPASDKISVKGFASGNVVDAIVITNMSGQVMYSTNVEGLASVDVDLNGFDNGMYFVTIYNQIGSEVVKFIKE